MMLNYEKNFESIAETYGGFPLKEDFLAIGNKALEQFGVQAELDERVIRIPYIDRSRFTAEELKEMWPDEEDDPEDWRVKLNACFELSEDRADGVKDAWYEYELIAPDDVDEDKDYDITDEEYDLAIKLIETFLNETVDCG